MNNNPSESVPRGAVEQPQRIKAPAESFAIEFLNRHQAVTGAMSEIGGFQFKSSGPASPDNKSVYYRGERKDGTKIEIIITQGADYKSPAELVKSCLREVYEILRTDRMHCDNMGTSVRFNSEYDNERLAINAENALLNLGLSPTREGTKVSLRAIFSEENIKDAGKYTIHIKPEKRD